MFSPEALAITYGLSSAVTWGAGDFSGGFASKGNSVFTVILFSQTIGAVLLIILALLFSENIPRPCHLVIGAMAGIFGSCGLIALYKGLATGRMGIVAPLSAVVTAIIPMVFAFFYDGFPKNAQMFGFLIALLAVWFLSSSGREKKIRLHEMLLPVLAGTGFGVFFVLSDQVTDYALLWPLVSARLGAVGLLLTIFLILRHRVEAPSRDRLLFIALAGVFDTGGNAFFAMATRLGRLDTSAVLSSLYPAATVILAWLILKEHLAPRQWLGMVAALFALVLIAS